MLNRFTLVSLRRAALTVRENSDKRDLCLFDDEQAQAVQTLIGLLPDVLALCDLALEPADGADFWGKSNQQSGSDGHIPDGTTASAWFKPRDIEGI